MIELFGLQLNIDLLRLMLIVLPMYFTNSSAMLFGRGKVPIDLGKNFFDGKRIFGKGKTFKGAVNGIIIGVFIAFFLILIFSNIQYSCETQQCVQPLSLFGNYLLYGFLSSFGAIIGDLVGSFIKRRLSIESGKESILLDQLPFVLVALTFTSFLYLPNLEEFIVILILTVILHRISNVIAYNLKLKSVPY